MLKKVIVSSLVTSCLVGLFLPVLISQVAPVIAPNTPFKAAFEHERVAGDNYRVWCDGVIVKNYAESELQITGTAPKQTITVTVPGLPRGAHSCFPSAYNDLADVKGEAISIPIGTIPAVPTQFRIVIEIVK